MTAEYRRGRAAGAAIVVHYQGTEVNLVMEPSEPGAEIDVEVSLDGEPLRPGHVDGPRLYRLVTDGPAGDHTLEVPPPAPAYAPRVHVRLVKPRSGGRWAC